ncbi:MAG TPA: hypothetical protein VLF71_06175 [Candidatus Saccharimonadales bacterium]|nr:hypothetical protein [Candidatus Saccharimonadales bacterium]
MPNNSVKLLGPVAIGVIVVLAVALVALWPRGKASSLSGHAGAQRASYWLFAAVLLLDGLLFFTFIWRWFVPALQLPAAYGYLAALGYLLQIATAVIPDTGGHSRASRMHAWVAFSMAAVMQLMVGGLVLAPHVAAVPRVFAAAVFGAMGVFWWLFACVKSVRRHFLVYQLCYIGGFFVVVLAAAYIR